MSYGITFEIPIADVVMHNTFLVGKGKTACSRRHVHSRCAWAENIAIA